MKQILAFTIILMLTACSHKPPQPHGEFFPINPKISATETAMVQLNNQTSENNQ